MHTPNDPCLSPCNSFLHHVMPSMVPRETRKRELVVARICLGGSPTCLLSCWCVRKVKAVGHPCAQHVHGFAAEAAFDVVPKCQRVFRRLCRTGDAVFTLELGKLGVAH